MTRARSLLGRILEDTGGVTMVEFALISPVLLLMLMGMFDMGYNIYAKILLEGAIQQAARDSTIEGASGSSATIDQAVERAVKRITPKATMTFDRKAYSSFSDVSQPEDFTDVNDNGICDANEPFEDVNGNGSWDQDRGIDGFGGARDAVLYTVTVDYPRLFPIANMIGLPDHFTAEAVTVLRNQPYGAQETVVTVGKCDV